jgi:hypothetical protein
VASPRAFRAKTGMSAMPTEANGSMLSWVHFGDLHGADAIGVWTEKGILGTQLGPNKYGRKR